MTKYRHLYDVSSLSSSRDYFIFGICPYVNLIKIKPGRGKSSMLNKRCDDVNKRIRSEKPYTLFEVKVSKGGLVLL